MTDQLLIDRLGAAWTPYGALAGVKEDREETMAIEKDLRTSVRLKDASAGMYIVSAGSL